MADINQLKEWVQNNPKTASSLLQNPQFQDWAQRNPNTAQSIMQQVAPQQQMTPGIAARLGLQGTIEGMPRPSTLADIALGIENPVGRSAGAFAPLTNALQSSETAARTTATPLDASRYGSQLNVPMLGKVSTGQLISSGASLLPQVATMKGFQGGMIEKGMPALQKFGAEAASMGMQQGISQPTSEMLPAVAGGTASYIPMGVGGGIGGEVAGRFGQALGMGLGGAAFAPEGKKLEPFLMGTALGVLSDPKAEMKRRGDIITNTAKQVGPSKLAQAMEGFARIPTSHTETMLQFPKGFDDDWMQQMSDIRNTARKQYVDPIRQQGDAAPVVLVSVIDGLKKNGIISPDGTIETAGLSDSEGAKLKKLIGRITGTGGEVGSYDELPTGIKKSIPENQWNMLSPEDQQKMLRGRQETVEGVKNFRQANDLEQDIQRTVAGHYNDIREGREPKGNKFTGKIGVLYHLVSDAIDQQYPQAARASALNRIYEQINTARQSFKSMRGSFFNTIAPRILAAHIIGGPAASLGAYLGSVPMTYRGGIKAGAGLKEAVVGKPEAGAMFKILQEGKSKKPTPPSGQGPEGGAGPSTVPTQPEGPVTSTSLPGTAQTFETNPKVTPGSHLAGQVASAIQNAKSPEEVREILNAAKENAIVPYVGVKKTKSVSKGKIIGSALLAGSLALSGGGSATAQAQEQRLENGKKPAVGKTLEGVASTYGWGEKLNRHTASGQVFDPNAMTAASYKYPLGSKVKVTDTKTGNSVVVTINDRGPNKRLNRLIDLSKGAWKKLGVGRKGLTNVKVEPL